MDARYLSPADTIVYCSIVSIEALYHLVDRKQIPYTRIGRNLRFDRLKLDAWLERRAVAPGGKRGQRDERLAS